MAEFFSPNPQLEEEKKRQRESFFDAFEKPKKEDSLPFTMGLLSAGAQILADSGYPYNPPTTGQIIGRGLMQGIQGYQLGQGMLRQERADKAAAEKAKREAEAFQVKQEYDNEVLEKTKRDNELAKLQMDTYNRYEQNIDAAVKNNLITDQDAAYLQTMDPVSGMKLLTSLVGKNRTKLTGVTAEAVKGPNGEPSNHMAFYQEMGDGTKKFIKIEANPNVVKKSDIKLGSELNTLFNADGFDKQRYYMRDKDGKWNPVDPNSFKDAMALKTKADKVLEQYGDLKRQYNTIQDNVAVDSAAGDLAIVFSFMKMLDPGSVVRESEFGSVIASSGYFDRAVQWYNKNFGKDSGERLPQELRNQLLTVARQIKERFRTEADTKIQSFNDLKNTRQGIDFQQLQFVNPFDDITDVAIPLTTSNNSGNSGNEGSGNEEDSNDMVVAPGGEAGYGDNFAKKLNVNTWQEYRNITGEKDELPIKDKPYKKVNPNPGTSTKINASQQFRLNP